MIAAPSWLEPRVETSREESGEDTVEAASRSVGGADESRVANGGRLVCPFAMLSLFVAVFKAF